MPRRPSFSARLAALILPVALLAACGGPPSTPKSPVRELPAPAYSLLAQAPSMYGSAAPIALPEDQGSAAAQATFASLAGSKAVHEPSLDLVAAVVGKTFAQEEELPADALLQWLYWKCGATSVPGPVNVLVAPEGSEGYFQEHMQRLAAIVASVDSTISFGVSRTNVMGYVAQTIALGFRPADVAPIPKSHAPGASVPVRIKPRKPYANLMLYVDQGGPNVTATPMRQEPDGSFSGEAALPSVPGRYFTEVVGVDLPADGDVEKGWRVSMVWVPLHVGVAEPAAPDDFIRRPQKNHPDKARWPVQIINAYNDARGALGRAPLSFEAEATELAQARSEELSGLSTTPPPELGLYGKFADAGLPVRNLFGYVDQIEYVSEYITLRLLRPAARFAIFDPSMTTLALGISPKKVPPGPAFHTSVEYVFAKIKVDPPKERARILSELDAAEIAAGGNAFTVSEPLSAGAQAIVDEVCRGGPTPKDAQKVFARVNGLDPALRRRGAVPWLGYDLTKEEVVKVHEKVKTERYTHAGVGICQGTVEGHKGAIMALVLFAGP